jgi:hypothetical protein
MSEPPRLNYSFKPAAPRPTRGQRVIGLLGFLAYCLPAFVFDLVTIKLAAIAMGGVRQSFGYSTASLVTFGLLGIFCTWRAIAALIQLLK